MSEWIIQTSKLTRGYGLQTSVNEINMRVKAGGVYGFLGPNGAGKYRTDRVPRDGVFQSEIQGTIQD